ncbi:MAG: hypothetical protein KatS3mg076_0248 [Candidatus Binatia bacterium]|nr:MAG: hypothetical protein KatS3mg076_0248 [Candidatus Binatia bacterium]
MRNPKAGSGGSSLVEALVALAVFALVAGGLGAATVASTRANLASKRISAAAALVNDKIEELRSLDPALAGAQLAPGTYTDPQNPIDESGEPGGTYERTWQIAGDIPAPGLRRVVVQVSWNDPSPRVVTGVTYLCAKRECN